MAVPLPKRLTLSTAVGPTLHVPIQKSNWEASSGSPGCGGLPWPARAGAAGERTRMPTSDTTSQTFLFRIHTSVSPVVWREPTPAGRQFLERIVKNCYGRQCVFFAALAALFECDRATSKRHSRISPRRPSRNSLSRSHTPRLYCLGEITMRQAALALFFAFMMLFSFNVPARANGTDSGERFSISL